MKIREFNPNKLAIPRPKASGFQDPLASNKLEGSKDLNENFPDEKLHQPERISKRFKTIANNTNEVNEKNISTIRNTALALATTLGVSTSAFAFLARIFSKDPNKKDCFANKAEKVAKRSTAASYSIFALINTLRAIHANDAGLAFSNFLEIPISFFSPAEDLTLNRGTSIGLGNIVMEAQKIYSKLKYNSPGESLNYLMKSLKKTYQAFKANPVGAITDTKHGTGAIIFSSITAISPLIKKLTGSNFLAYNFRHWPGILQELGKIDMSNLKRGAFNYWTCGVMMFLSSAINLTGSMFKEHKHSSEILTWIPNVLGRRLLAAANIYRETSKDRIADPVTVAQAAKLAMKEILHQNHPAKNFATVA